MAHQNDASPTPIRIGDGPDEIPLTDAELGVLLTELETELGADDFAQLMGQIASEEADDAAARRSGYADFKHWALEQPALRELFMLDNTSEIISAVITFFKIMLGGGSDYRTDSPETHDDPHGHARDDTDGEAAAERSDEHAGRSQSADDRDASS